MMCLTSCALLLSDIASGGQFLLLNMQRYSPNGDTGDVEAVIFEFSRIKYRNLSHKYGDYHER